MGRDPEELKEERVALRDDLGLEVGLRGRRTPLGNPVVPEVYVMEAPARRSIGAVVGCPSFNAE